MEKYGTFPDTIHHDAMVRSVWTMTNEGNNTSFLNLETA